MFVINIPEDSKTILERMKPKRRKVRSIFKDLLDKPFRQDQEEIILAGLLAIDDGFKNILVRSPVGSGKSVSALAIAKLHSPFYLLSQSLSLTHQYRRDFPFLEEIKGRRNFRCKMDPKIASDEAPCTTIKKYECLYDTPGAKFVDACGTIRSRFRNCDYWHTKYDCATSPETLTTPHYLFREQSGKRSLFGERQISIFDEAHDLPHTLSTIIEEYWSLTNHEYLRGFKFGVVYLPTLTDIKEWKNYFSSILGTIDAILSELDELIESSPTDNMFKRYSKVERMKDRVNDTLTLLEDPDNVIITKYKEVFYFKPIRPTPFAKKFLEKVSDVRIFMSATIIPDITIKELDLDPDKTIFISVNRSSFPIKNRQIHAVNVALTHRSNYSKAIPRLRKFIVSILDLPKFKNQNSLILAPSYELCGLMEEELNGYFAGQILSYNNSEDRQKAIELF